MINVLLKGLTGPVNGKDCVALMVPMESNDDAWFASVASYVRTSFGNQASLVDTNDVARLRAANLARTQPWTAETLRGSPTSGLRAVQALAVRECAETSPDTSRFHRQRARRKDVSG